MKYQYDIPTGCVIFEADSDEAAMKYIADLPDESQFVIYRLSKVIWDRTPFAMGAMDPKTHGKVEE